MIRTAEPHFAVATVVIRQRSSLQYMNETIIKVAVEYRSSDTIQEVHQKVLSEVTANLSAAHKICDGAESEALKDQMTSMTA